MKTTSALITSHCKAVSRNVFTQNLAGDVACHKFA